MDLDARDDLSKLTERISRLERVNREALDALLEAEQEQWVTLDSGDGEDPYIRISRDGNRAQDCNCERVWQDYDAWWIKAAYLTGLRVGAEEERAKARELVQAVANLDRSWPAKDVAACIALAKALLEVEG